MGGEQRPRDTSFNVQIRFSVQPYWIPCTTWQEQTPFYQTAPIYNQNYTLYSTIPLPMGMAIKSESPYHSMPQDSLENLSLLTSDDCSTPQTPCSDSKCLHKIRLLRVALFLQFLFLAMIIGGAIGFYFNHIDVSSTYLYSPVQHLITYENRVFHEGFGSDVSLYQQAPSPEVDDAWEDLYDFGVSKITKEEASKLVNQTYRLPGDEKHYVVHLDVFHQLHCLNMLRKALHPEYYKEGMHMNRQHLDHCVENIRQSLMCSADVTPLVWQWVDRVQEVRIMGNIMHKCRNYDKIREWGLKHRLDHELNFTGFH